jgi:hypothetical protein
MNVITGDSSGYTTEPDESVTLEDAKEFIALTWREDKFTDQDVTPGLEEYALAYVREYVGDFDYMLSMQHDFGRYGSLSIPKLRGVLNCLRAEVKREQAHQQRPTQEFSIESLETYVQRQAEEPASVIEVAAGRYCILEPFDALLGAKRHFYQVDQPTKGRWVGYTFLKEIHLRGSDNGERSIRDREEREKVLLAIAADADALSRYGRETGTCGCCHRTLTDPESVSLGIGPICRQRLAA